MTQVQVLIDAAQIILTVVFWVSLLFPVVVGTFWRWWQTDFGNSYVWKVILLAVVSSSTAFREMFGVDSDALWFRYYVTFALACIPIVIVWRTWILWRHQRRGKSLNPYVAIRDWRLTRRPNHQENGGKELEEVK